MSKEVYLRKIDYWRDMYKNQRDVNKQLQSDNAKLRKLIDEYKRGYTQLKNTKDLITEATANLIAETGRLMRKIGKRETEKRRLKIECPDCGCEFELKEY